MITIDYTDKKNTFNKQLKAAGKEFDTHKLSHFSKDAQAIARLEYRKIISTEEADKLRTRLTKRINHHVDTYKK